MCLSLEMFVGYHDAVGKMKPRNHHWWCCEVHSAVKISRVGCAQGSVNDTLTLALVKLYVYIDVDARNIFVPFPKIASANVFLEGKTGKVGQADKHSTLRFFQYQLWHFPNPVDRLASTMPCQICKTKIENSFTPCVFQSEMLEAKITLKWKWSKWSISNPKSRKSRHLCESKTAKRKRFARLNPRCQAWNQHICDTHPFS